MATALTELLETKEEAEIKDFIYEFRGKQVMLDSDIAKLFEVETNQLNQQRKRNETRFPEDFCFKLNSSEFKSLKSQIVTSNEGRGGRRKLPYVYTEQVSLLLLAFLEVMWQIKCIYGFHECPIFLNKNY